MQRISVPKRDNWVKRVEDLGFYFHTIEEEGVDPTYWDESHAYQFTSAEIDKIDDATRLLYRMSLSAVDRVIRTGDLARFKIPEEFWPLVTRSWERQDLDMYGRFDLAFDSTGTPKMLEFNADTPTSLFEASVVQWFWLEDYMKASGKKLDQFNSIHEKLSEVIKCIGNKYLAGNPWYFSSVRESVEDRCTADYLQDLATQQGFKTQHIDIEDIGWNGQYFTDLDEKRIQTIFKLYPWEFLVREDFGKFMLGEPWNVIEPAWKLILSNKEILTVLWEMYPGHPNLLATYKDPTKLGSTYVKKPLLSREGADITIVRDNVETTSHSAAYGQEGYIFQEYLPLAKFDNFTPILGSWVVGGEPAGLGIREDLNEITGNNSHFIPHFFDE